MAPWFRSSTIQLILLLSSLSSIHTRDPLESNSTLSTTWTNNGSLDLLLQFSDGGYRIRPILFQTSMGFNYACGFFRYSYLDEFFLFSVLIYPVVHNPGTSKTAWSSISAVVWSANSHHLVRENATLQFSQDGNLILRDADGSFVWSTNTSNRSVNSIHMTGTGNLVLLDSRNGTVWQSFDHPSDSLLPGQRLFEGQRLSSTISSSNWTEGLYYLSIINDTFAAFIDTDRPQIYYWLTAGNESSGNQPKYIELTNETLSVYLSTVDRVHYEFSIPSTSSLQFVKLDWDGHLRAYEWRSNCCWREVADLFSDSTLSPILPGTRILSECAYPSVCGHYGICSNQLQCRCPSDFVYVNDAQPTLGCSEITPLSCGNTQYHQLLDLEGVTYFNLFSWDATTDRTIESCKEACLTNCSCRAGFFENYTKICYLPSQVHSLMEKEDDLIFRYSSAFIKVEILPISPSPMTTGRLNETEFSSPQNRQRSRINMAAAIVVGTITVALFIALLYGYIKSYGYLKSKKENEDEGYYFDKALGMPCHFSYEELRVATEDFSKKLGEGGFGSVFEGVFSNGTRIGVKCLSNMGQGTKEFLAEVQTIGNIHHINLVRLIGFCTEKSSRILVYEYMINGSLEKWIFHKNQHPTLDWETRKKIILDIARGLAYLHEECRQRIAHLDIKPQNILLDENFNAKVSDFGLSRLIDRDQSQVITTMRGTRGYLAPEWLSRKITEKVDVYSFGVVVLEIVCGRKNLDNSRSESDIILLNVLKKKAKEDRIISLVDDSMQFDAEEAKKMLKIGVWCLKEDYTRRPPMSIVVKVLEGVMDLENSLDYEFSVPNQVEGDDLSLLQASVLSGPR